MVHRRIAPSAASCAWLALLVTVSCGPDEPTTPATDGSPLALYRQVKCSSCHGENAEGVARMGPPLNDIAANWNQEELERYLEDPAPFRSSKPHLEALSQTFFAHMRAFPELSAPQRTQLAVWLLER